MLKLSVLDVKGQSVGEIELSEAIFGIKPNMSVVHDMVVNHLANKRRGTQSALTRAEVSGGGRKPWRQKGTGHARQGSIRSPQWRHGGVVFAPKPRDYSYTINKKVKRLAMKSVFSEKFANKGIIVLDNIFLNEYKTKTMIEILENLGVASKAMIVLPEPNDKVVKSTANIPGVKTVQVNNLCVYDMVNAKKLVILKDSVKKIEEVYA